MADTPRLSLLGQGLVSLLGSEESRYSYSSRCMALGVTLQDQPLLSDLQTAMSTPGAACFNSVIGGGIRPNSNVLPKLGDSRNVTFQSCCKRPLVTHPLAKLPPLPLTPTQTTSRNTSAICIPLLLSLP